MKAKVMWCTKILNWKKYFEVTRSVRASDKLTPHKRITRFVSLPWRPGEPERSYLWLVLVCRWNNERRDEGKLTIMPQTDWKQNLQKKSLDGSDDLQWFYLWKLQLFTALVILAINSRSLKWHIFACVQLTNKAVGVSWRVLQRDSLTCCWISLNAGNKKCFVDFKDASSYNHPENIESESL